MELRLSGLAPEDIASASQIPTLLSNTSSYPVEMCGSQDLPLRASVPYL